MPRNSVDTMEAIETLVSAIPTVRKQRVVRPHWLEQEEGDGAPLKIKLDKVRLIVGRADDADVRIRHPKASRHHATMIRKNGEYKIEDNGSRNGFYLNGLRVNSAILREGDVIQITDCVFLYHER